MSVNKKIILGITGGSAAVKAPELAKRLKAAGFAVRAVLTPSAGNFFSSADLRPYIEGKPISEFSYQKGDFAHLTLAEAAEAFIIAPITANTLAKLAVGLADNVLTTTALSVSCPIFLAPAMNSRMWLNPAVQANVEILKRRGAIFVGPTVGPLACGEAGIGRMAEPRVIVSKLTDYFDTLSCLRGKKVIVTAGGTREPWDEVRFLGNRSTGKMGYALAEAARQAGADVVLISAPTELTPPAVELVPVTTAAEMAAAVMKYFQAADALIMAAAVADYGFSRRYRHKIKKTGQAKKVTLKPQPDILKTAARQKKEQILIGFAAESGNLITEARRKLHEKKLDFIVANDISQNRGGFGAAENAAVIVKSNETIELPLMPKEQMARIIIKELAALFKA